MSALAVVALRPWIIPEEIESSWLLLAAYVFLFLNLEVLVSYWLAQGRSLPVMVYTLLVTVWRLGTLLAATLYYKDVEMIFVTIVCAEALKNVADLRVAARARTARVPLASRRVPRTGEARRAARHRLGAQQGQRLR